MRTSDTSPSANGRGPDSWSRSRLSGYCRVTFDHPPISTHRDDRGGALELVGLVESRCAGVASSIAEMIGEQGAVELVAATAKRSSAARSGRDALSSSLAGVSRTSARTTASGRKG